MEALRRQGAPTKIADWVFATGLREVTGAEFSGDGEKVIVKGLAGCFVVVDAFR